MVGQVHLEDHEAALCIALAVAAQVASAILGEEVIGAVPARFRSRVLHIAGRLTGERLYGPSLRSEIAELTQLLGSLVDDGTFVEWQAEDNHVRGGNEAIVLTEDARTLRRAILALNEVEAASIALTVFSQAMRIRSQLPMT